MAKKLKTLIRPVSRDKGAGKLARMPVKRENTGPGGAPIPTAPPAEPEGPPKSPEELYDEMTVDAPLLNQGDLPRTVSPLSLVAACSGNRFGFIAAAWMGMLAVITMIILRGSSEIPAVFLGVFAFFGVVGIVIAYLGVRRGKKAVHLVRNGMLTWALITNVEKITSTSTDSDGNRSTSVSYDVSFVYRVDGQGLEFGETNVASASAITDDKQELLIYDPEKPEKVEFADLLPGGLRINVMGETSASTFFNVMGLLPFLIIFVIPLLGYLFLIPTLPSGNPPAP